MDEDDSWMMDVARSSRSAQPATRQHDTGAIGGRKQIPIEPKNVEGANCF